MIHYPQGRATATEDIPLLATSTVDVGGPPKIDMSESFFRFGTGSRYTVGWHLGSETVFPSYFLDNQYFHVPKTKSVDLETLGFLLYKYPQASIIYIYIHVHIQYNIQYNTIYIYSKSTGRPFRMACVCMSTCRKYGACAVPSVSRCHGGYRAIGEDRFQDPNYPGHSMGLV